MGDVREERRPGLGVPLLLIGALLLGGGAVWVLGEGGDQALPTAPGAQRSGADEAASLTTRAQTSTPAPADPARLPSPGARPGSGEPLAPGALTPVAAAELPGVTTSPGIAGGATLAGRVVDGGGRPVPGAVVELTGVRRDAPMAISVLKDGDGPPRLVRTGERRMGPRTTDEQGRYRFEGVAPEVRWRIGAAPPAETGLLSASADAPPLQDGQVATAPDLVAARPASLSGVVRHPDGQPVADARVLLGQLDGPLASMILAGEEPADDERGARVMGKPQGPQGPGPKPAAGGTTQRAEKAMMFSVAGTSAGLGLGAPAPLETRTDAQGRFSFAAVPPGPQTVQAQQRGLRPAREELELREGEVRQGLELQLLPPLTLTVRVLDPAGRAVEKARVMALGSGPGRAQRTDADGRVELTELQQAALTLSVDADGFVPLTTTVEVPEDAAAAPVELVLRRGATLVGTVVRKSDRTPLAEGFVFAEPLVHDGRINLVMNGEDGRVREGRFKLAGVAPGRYRLRATHPRLAEVTREVEVAPGSELLDVGELALGELGSIAVTVLDPDGQPAAGAEVQLGLRLPGGGSGATMMVMTAVRVADDEDGEDDPPAPAFRGLGGRVRTDAQGQALLPAVQPGKATVQATLDGFAPAYSDELAIPEDGSTVAATLRLTRGGRVSGRVRQGSAPQAGAQVLLLRQGQPIPAGQTTSDAQGAFAFERIAPGRYRLSLEAGPRLAGGPQPAPEWFEVADGATVTRDLSAPALVRLEGSVRDADGAPLAGVRVVVGPLFPAGLGGGEARVGFAEAEAVSDAAGRFTLDGLSPGGRERAIGFTPADGAPRTFRLALEGSGTVRREWQLEGDAAQGTLTARVCDPQGAALGGEPVTLESLDPERPLVRRERPTGPDGAVSFEALPAGRYALSAGAAPYARARVEVTLSGATATAPLLQLTQGGTLAVELPAGDWGQAAIELSGAGEPPRITSGAAGAVARVGGLTPGREYAVTVRAEGCAPWQATVRAQPGEVSLRAVLVPAPQ